jgi:hypothetical protein
VTGKKSAKKKLIAKKANMQAYDCVRKNQKKDKGWLIYSLQARDVHVWKERERNKCKETEERIQSGTGFSGTTSKGGRQKRD